MKPIGPTLRKNLLRLIRAYAKVSGLEPSSICVYAYGDSRLMEKLEKGSGFSDKTYDKLIAWFTRQVWKGHAMPVLIDPNHHQQEKSHGSKAPSIRDRGKGRKVVAQTEGRKARGGKTGGSQASGQARR